ncbi:MAG: hypothetical protein HC783_04390 [Rhodobacteraceae bacterium]|nr:hypothetical protein [Paracoccaceae bacterium]
MCAFQTSHYLEDGTEAPMPRGGKVPSRSAYSYLFPDLADAPDAGCFQGTDDIGTIQRLKEFEKAFDPGNPLFAPPALTFDLPAAYTYFGQFLNHDISAPVGGLLQNLGQVPPVGIIGTANPDGLGKDRRADVATILQHFMNEHARPLSLASLYGDGPGSDDERIKALYEPDGSFHLAKVFPVPPDILAETTKRPANALDHAKNAPDIPRSGLLPLIADRRNDGNLILSQLHLAFLMFHNKAVAKLTTLGASSKAVFTKARDLVTKHYHWLILNDFLPAILSRSVLAKPLADWTPRSLPAWTVPFEFTTAAFRFGHSMVGRSYDYNANFGRENKLADRATLAQLFSFTSARQMGDPWGRIPQLPDHWVIDWDRMTRSDAPANPKDASGRAERIDLVLAPDMLSEAGDARITEQGSILLRNLLRGFHRRMPFGQKLATACGVQILPREKIRAAMPQRPSPSGTYPAKIADALGILDETPAWLYFLCEAKVLEDGTRIGPTASQIIADTILSLLQHHASPVLRNGGTPWHPRDSPLQDMSGKPIESLRSFLLFASHGP